MSENKESQVLEAYFVAAQMNEIPDDLATPRHVHKVISAAEQREIRERCAVMTRIWNAADSDAGRRVALAEYMKRADARRDIKSTLDMFLDKACNHLPPGEIEFAMAELGLAEEDNGVLSDAEKRALDHDGFVNLGQLLDADQVTAMRARYDAAISAEGAAAAQTKGIARIETTVVKAMNRDGLLDPIFMHPRLLAAVRHILGVHLKYIGSNFHCAMPGYGHQGIHADFIWGVEKHPEVVNAIWLIDDFTEENGPTRVVPGSHRSCRHPRSEVDDLDAPVEGEVKLTASAGSCIVYNAHLWHSGTQNCSKRLRRAQHAFFSRSHRPSTDVLAVIDRQVYQRLGRVERAVLDIE